MRLLLLSFILFATFASQSQKGYSLAFTTDHYKSVKRNVPHTFKDSLSAIQYVEQLRQLGIKRGYLLSSVDSIHYSNKTFTVSFYTGQKFEYATLNIAKADLPLLRKEVRLREKAIVKIPFTPDEISRMLLSIQNEALSKGYPFSKVTLQEVEIHNTDLSADLLIDKGSFYTISDIHIKGDSSISEVFISSLLGIKIGDPYNESALSDISKKVGQISFLKEIKPHELLFTKNGIELYLYLQSNPVSSINGALGLQPNPVTSRIGVVGELNLKLLNVLKNGELLSLSWRSIQTQTQSLNARVNYPFLFKSPFGIDAQLQMYKRDTTFLELRTTLGIQYFLKGGNYLRAFYQNYTSNMLSGSTNNTDFSNLSTIRTNAYGLSMLRRQLDYIPNPSRGLGIVAEIAIGNRKSQTVDTISAIRSTTYRTALQVEWYIPLTRRNIIRLASSSEFYYAPTIYQNELYRFGGLTTLRGFNEEELFASGRSVLTLEYRFLLDKNSNLFAFYDQGMYENSSTKYYRDHPFGFGAGFSFGTNFGIFSFSYALGKQLDNQITMRNGKIHFGYIAYF
jgi:outer membrane protein assembly factor BamA